MSLCPDVLFHRDPECFRHFLESICPLRGFLGIADALLGELRQHDISCHNRPPWLEACATWHEEGAPSLPQSPRRGYKIDRSADISCPALLPRSRGSCDLPPGLARPQRSPKPIWANFAVGEVCARRISSSLSSEKR